MAFIRVEADGIELNAQVAATYGPYRLAGGRYAFVASGTGTVQLLISFGPDGATNVPVATAITLPQTAIAIYDIPPGCYVVTITTGPASASIQRIKLG